MEHIPQSSEWHAWEFSHDKKTSDWYWALWIITASISVASIILTNILLAIFIVLGASIATFFSTLDPKFMEYAVNRLGLRVGNTLYPHSSLDSFWIEHHDHTATGEVRLLVKSKKFLMPLIVVPLGDTDDEGVRAVLLQYLPEVEHHESIIHRFFERLGF